MKRKIATICLAALLLAGCRPAVPAETVPTEPPLPENPYGIHDFTYENGYLTCTAGACLSGVDVSAHQGEIDWETVHGEGFSFAMIRVGYRGWGSGALVTDEWAAANIDGAHAAGMQVGCYFFSQAINPQEAEEEAQFVLDFLQDRQIELPVVFDWEIPAQEARTAGMDGEVVTACAKAFCDRIRQAGRTPMIYFNLFFMDRYLYLKELRDYRFWLALYDSPMSCPVKVDMWQYTATGYVSGISGNVDIDLLFLYDEV